MKNSNYTNVQIWNEQIKPSQRLHIINKQDFPRKQILEGLGINSTLATSFGITDPAEIRERQSVIKFLLQNPAVRATIKETFSSNIPTDGNRFMEYYNPENKNPHWENVHNFIDAINKADGKIPKRLLQVIETLREKEDLEKTENEIGKAIKTELAKVTAIEGIVTFPWNEYSGVHMENKNFKIWVHGHRSFSSDLCKIAIKENPRWSRKSFRTLGLSWLVGKIKYGLNNMQINKAKSTMVIKELANSQIREILNGVRTKLSQIKLSDHTNGKNQMDEANIDVYFSYSETGLSIQIVGIQPIFETGEFHFSFNYDQFEGYSHRHQQQIENAREKVGNIIKESEKAHFSGLIRTRIEEEKPKFFDKTIVESPNFDSVYKWFAVQQAFESTRFSTEIEPIQEHRDFFYRHTKMLARITRVAETMEEKARSLGTPLCFPEIIDQSTSSIILKNIYPIHLMNQKIKLVPIDGIGEINGGMIALTGANGGGKTSAKLSITDNIFLAQSGLPVFGERFALTIKKTLGLVFVDKGEGSTCQRLFIKIQNILEHLEQNDGEDVLVILDELGTGTAECDVIDLGKKILNKLFNSNASVIFSTQIRTLAEHARDKLQAKCCHFNRQHKLSEGIGKADPKGLADELGLSKLL